MLACAYRNIPIQVMVLILQKSPNVNQQDGCGRSALYLACRAGSIEKVQILLQMPGINVNIRTCGGDTPLMAAVTSTNKDMVILCLENNFSPFLYNSIKQNARDYAMMLQTSKSEILKLIDLAIE